MPISFNPDRSDTNSRVFASATVTVTTSETLLTAGATASEVQFIRVYNGGNEVIYVGPSTQTLEPLYKKQWIEYAINNFQLYGKTLSGTSDVVVTELG